ncbi:hypothetical protein SAMN05518856_104327 [Paenibacillus sp. OK003]|nr:hypothetical protein SAMN05518856_104327 [Paenibacillus sp. OK003]
MLKKCCFLVYLLFVVLITLSACEQTNTSTNEDKPTVAVGDIHAKDTNTEISPSTRGGLSKNASDFVAEDKSELSAVDFETAYPNVCASSI